MCEILGAPSSSMLVTGSHGLTIKLHGLGFRVYLLMDLSCTNSKRGGGGPEIGNPVSEVRMIRTGVCKYLHMCVGIYKYMISI